MKKNLVIFCSIFLLFCNHLRSNAQSQFTADLELIFRDTVRHFVVEPFDEGVDIGLAVVNHGPDDIDTSGFILFSMTGIPDNYSLVVQSDSGDLLMLPSGDTIKSRGVMFSQEGDFTADTTYKYCYFLKTNDDFEDFIYDPNQQNDTICFYVTYKKNDSLTSVRNFAQVEPLILTPNPTSSFVTVPLNTIDGLSATVSVFSMDGREVYSQKIKRNHGNSLTIDVANWNKGVYVLQILAERKLKTAKFTVQ